MPPKKKTLLTSSTKESCGICCQSIALGKDESLFCAGDCQQWLHRYCAGVSVKNYKEFKENVTSFLCFACSESRSKREILLLKDSVDQLKREIAELKESLSAARSTVRGMASDGHQARHVQPSYASCHR